ncbi:MAG TPA: hypothetical protein VLC94_06250 [Candidatus Acidoferrum sp.]|nr:hypothetical protein [Candidatus Acidoferrum sp.]
MAKRHKNRRDFIFCFLQKNFFACARGTCVVADCEGQGCCGQALSNFAVKGNLRMAESVTDLLPFSDGAERYQDAAPLFLRKIVQAGPCGPYRHRFTLKRMLCYSEYVEEKRKI